MIKRSSLLPIGLCLTVGLAILATAVVGLWPQAKPVLPRVPIGGPFQLTTQDAQPFKSESLNGKPFVIFFGFTHCPEVCPTTLYDLTQDLQALGAEADKLNVVFVTIDPEQDTPELMKTYLSSFDPHIIGLTGTPDEIATAAQAYRVYYRKVPTESGYTMDHTATVFLMDRKGDFFGASNYQEAPETRLDKLKRLIKDG